MKEAEGAQIRSRAKWVEKGEKNTKFFLNLETRRQTNNTISSIKNEKGELLCKSDTILHEGANFYKTLYKTRQISSNNISAFIDDILINNKLSTEDASKCEGLVCENECTIIVNKMSLNKSPGYDGLSNEFYKHFWNDIKQLVVASFNEAFEMGELSESHKQIVISLLFKKGDRKLFKNYRPISLSNVDYKILAFVLAKRIQKIIGKLISPEQVAYIENRYIGQNIRLVLDIMEYAKKNNKEGLLLFLDFEKAFDSLDWTFIEKALIKFGFKSDIRKWIKIIYTDPKAFLKINGFLSKTINIERGIRQGCPLSCLIFILCTEFLSLLFHQNKSIEGIKIEYDQQIKHIKICQYADVTCLFLRNLDELHTALNIVNVFSGVSGLNLNLLKTEGMFIGNRFGYYPNDDTIKWPHEAIKYLGIYLTTDDGECKQMNWQSKIEKMQKLVDSWRTRKLTLQGKIIIIKTLVLPKIIFPASILPIPDDIIKVIDKLLFHFLWNRSEKMERKVLISDYSDGGLCMIDTESHFMALKAAWVKRIYKGLNDIWTCLPMAYINKVSCGYLHTMNFKSMRQMPILNTLPKFYQEVCLYYSKSKEVPVICSKSDLYNQLIWGNRLFLVNEKCLYSRCFIESGFIYIRDILQDNGKLKGTIYESLVDKIKYLRVLSMITSALKPYKEMRFSTENIIISNVDRIDDINTRSKWFYNRLVKYKVKKAKAIKRWSQYFSCEIDWTIVYVNKYRFQFQVKFADFNFKMINNILPTKLNLLRWKKVENANCIYCNAEVHDCKHMLWDCKILTTLWQKVANVLGVNITWKNIVLGVKDERNINAIISMICYIIYKKYLADKDIQNDQINLFDYIISNIRSYFSIYTCQNCNAECRMLLDNICMVLRFQ